jgi:hypothetical protein
MPAGPYFRLAGEQVTVTILGHSVTADFVFESITRGTQRITRLGIKNGSIDFSQGGSTIQLRKANGGFIFYPTVAGDATSGGFAGELSGEVTVVAGPLQVSGKPILQINTSRTRDAVDETIVFDSGTVKFSVRGRRSR